MEKTIIFQIRQYSVLEHFALVGVHEVDKEKTIIFQIRQYSVLEHFALVGVHEGDMEKTMIPEEFIKNLAETCTRQHIIHLLL